MPLSINICRSTNCQRPTYKQTNKQKSIKKQETNSRKKNQKSFMAKSIALVLSLSRDVGGSITLIIQQSQQQKQQQHTHTRTQKTTKFN